MIGAANECVAACLALLDIGSQITSISESFYKKYLSDCVIHPVESLLRVVGAADQDVPFLGYVDVEVEFPVEEAGLKAIFLHVSLVHDITHQFFHLPSIISSVNGQQGLDFVIVGLTLQSICHGLTVHQILDGITHDIHEGSGRNQAGKICI